MRKYLSFLFTLFLPLLSPLEGGWFWGSDEGKIVSPETGEFVLPLGIEDVTLFCQIADNYFLAHSEKNWGAWLYEFIPEGQSIDDWHELVSIYYYPKRKLTGEYAQNVLQAIHSMPNSVQLNYQDTLDGYNEVRFWGLFFACQAIKFPSMVVMRGVKEVTVQDYIQGVDGMYMIQFAYRVPGSMDVKILAKEIDERKKLAFSQLQVQIKEQIVEYLGSQ